MKGKLKLLKLGLLGFVFLFASCEQEKNYMQNGNEKSIIQTVSLADIPLISQAISAKHSAHSITNKNSVDYLSLIIPDKVVVITDKNGYKTYTLGLNLPSTDKLQNLVVAETPTGIKYYLSTYTSPNFPQFLEEIDAKTKPSQIPDASYEALDIADSKFIIYCHFVCPSGMHDDSEAGDCDYDYSEWSEQCAYGSDMDQGNAGSWGGGSTGTAGGNSGSGSAGGPTGGGSGSGTGNAPGTNVGGTGANDGPIVVMITVPVHGGGNATDPCKKIKNQIAKYAALKPALQNLATKTSQNVENGIFLDNAAPSNAAPEDMENGASGQVVFNVSAPLVMFAHTHNSPASSTYSVFSYDDLIGIKNLIIAHKLDDDAVIYLITADGTQIAITIQDQTGFVDYFSPSTSIDQTKTNDIIKRWERYYGKKINPLIQENNTDNAADLKFFLQFLKEANLKVSVFSINPDFSIFTKMTLDNSNNVQQTNCN